MQASPARCPCHRWAWVTVRGTPHLPRHYQKQWGAPALTRALHSTMPNVRHPLLIKRTLGNPDICGACRQMSRHAHESHHPAHSSEHCHCVLCSQRPGQRCVLAQRSAKSPSAPALIRNARSAFRSPQVEELRSASERGSDSLALPDLGCHASLRGLRSGVSGWPAMAP